MTQAVARKRPADDDNQLELTTKKFKATSGQPIAVPTAPTVVLHDSGLPDSTSDTQGPMEKEARGNGVDLSGAVESEKKRGKRRADISQNDKEPSSAFKYRKLAPPRPFPTVPTSVSATGPRSAHVEGKNYICVTRKTPLAMYLRRCKDVVLNDGHKTLHLNAMGAAIPHMLQLALSLPEILPYPEDEIRTEVLTGTVEVQDEVIPEDEDEDISIRTRGKSTLCVVITIGDGVDEGPRDGKGKKKLKGHGDRTTARRGSKQTNDEGQKQKAGPSVVEKIVVREEDMNQN